MPPQTSPDTQGLFAAALDHHRGGRLWEAETLYRQVLAVDPRHAESLHYLGLIAFQRGRPGDAEILMREALGVNAEVAFFHSNLGLAQQAGGNAEGAIVSYGAALALDQAMPETQQNLGRALIATGRLAEAADALEAAVALGPELLEAWILLGDVRLAQGRLEAAAESYRCGLALRPDGFALHNSLGNVLQRQGKLGEAVREYERALECAPGAASERADVLGNLGSALQAEQRFEEAIAAYRKAVELRPMFPEAFYNIGIALQKLGRLEAASSAFVRALALKDDYAAAWNNLGNVCRAKDMFDDAAQCYRKVISLEPANVLAHYNLGCLLGDLGDGTGAVAAYGKALALAPGDAQVSFSMGLLELARGEFEAGWRNYEFRWQSSDHDTPRRPYTQPLWAGGALACGKLLLWGEQGIGDEIFFASLVRDAIATGNRVVLDCDARLVPLFARSFPEVEVVSGYVPREEVEAHLPLGSLARLFRREEADFAWARSPYLVAERGARDQFRARYGEDGRRTIGLAWHTRGKKTGKNRSIELGWLRSMFALPGIRWVSLQYGDHDSLEAEIEAAQAPVAIDRSVDQMKDVDGFAAQAAAMDLVITIDNSAAHVAGALGVPVWVLLPSPSDWRWLMGRADSLWYPSMRLFRQGRRGDWRSAIDEVERALETGWIGRGGD